jgi:hypothetical protein
MKIALWHEICRKANHCKAGKVNLSLHQSVFRFSVSSPLSIPFPIRETSQAACQSVRLFSHFSDVTPENRKNLLAELDNKTSMALIDKYLASDINKLEEILPVSLTT